MHDDFEKKMWRYMWAMLLLPFVFAGCMIGLLIYLCIHFGVK